MVVRDDSYALFYEKSIDELEAIEAGLLEIEQTSEDRISSLVNTLFRQVHNIKGSASFYDLHEVVAISHSMETLLGMLRTKHITVDPELIAILLSAKDWLARLLEDESAFDTEPIVTQLNTYIDAKIEANKSGESSAGTGVIEVALSDGNPIWKVSEATIMEAQNSAKGGKYVYLFVFDIIEDIEKKGRTPQDVIGEFDTLTKLIESKLDIALVGGMNDDSTGASIPLFLLCATIMDPLIVSEILGISEDNVSVICEEYISYPEEEQEEVDLERSTVYQMLRKEARNVPVVLTFPYGELSDLEKRLTLQSHYNDEKYLIQEILVAPTVASLSDEMVTALNSLAEKEGKRFDHEVTLFSSEPILFFLLVFKDEIHNLLENAVVHGIELPQDRIHNGKSMAGTITVTAEVTKQEILFSVYDNGRGISQASLAVHAEKLTPIGGNIVDVPLSELIDRLLTPGLFSLGAFAEKLTQYGGRITLKTHEQGVTVSVHIPL